MAVYANTPRRYAPARCVWYLTIELFYDIMKIGSTDVWRQEMSFRTGLKIAAVFACLIVGVTIMVVVYLTDIPAMTIISFDRFVIKSDFFLFLTGLFMFLLGLRIWWRLPQNQEPSQRNIGVEPGCKLRRDGD